MSLMTQVGAVRFQKFRSLSRFEESPGLFGFPGQVVRFLSLRVRFSLLPVHLVESSQPCSKKDFLMTLRVAAVEMAV